MNLAWSQPAIADRDAIFTYIATESPQAAATIDLRLADAVSQLAEHPQSGRGGRVEGTRELVIAGTPYLAIYAIGPGVVRILRILHGAQQWPPDPEPA